MLAPMPANQMSLVRKLVPAHLLTEPKFQETVKLLEEEINLFYLFSLRKGISKLLFIAQLQCYFQRITYNLLWVLIETRSTWYCVTVAEFNVC
jgi:hypothetical protein